MTNTINLLAMNPVTVCCLPAITILKTRMWKYLEEQHQKALSHLEPPKISTFNCSEYTRREIVTCNWSCSNSVIFPIESGMDPVNWLLPRFKNTIPKKESYVRKLAWKLPVRSPISGGIVPLIFEPYKSNSFGRNKNG